MPLPRFNFMIHLAHIAKLSRYKVPPRDQLLIPKTLFFQAKRQDLFQCNPHVATPGLLDEAKKPLERPIEQPQFIKTLPPRR